MSSKGFEGISDWEEGKRLDFGGALALLDRGEVENRRVVDDGRTEFGVRLESGELLYLVCKGEEWEGRMIPELGGAGWVMGGDAEGVWIQERERGAMICSTVLADGSEVAGLPPYVGPTIQKSGGSSLQVEEITPLLSSLPDAPGVIYLDFDGETVGGNWSASFNGGQLINAGSPGFTNAEIQRIWEGMAEDFRPFKVNITTDRSVYEEEAVNRRTMVVFTPDNEWYGAAGGVAYVDIFGSSFQDDPCWVFTDQLGNDASNSHEAASHEAGHVLGLRHDGTNSLGYYEGHGSGAVGWAPIMGVGYYKVVTQWSRGEYPNANNFEDDLAIIAKASNGLGYRSDDHAGSIGGATPLVESGTDQLDGAGLIERNTDVDVFSFQTSGGAVSFNIVNGAVDPNLDVRLRLLDAGGAEVLAADPAGTLDAALAATVAPGSYYVEISGTGEGNLTSGYGEYGSLGGYSISGTVPRDLVLAASIVSPTVAAISLRVGVGLLLVGVVTAGVASWEMVSGPVGGWVDFSTPNEASTEAGFGIPGIYQLRLRGVAGGEEEAADLTVSVETAGEAAVYGVFAPAVELGMDRNVYRDLVTLAPEIVDDSPVEGLGFQWSVISGDGQLSATSAMSPMLSYPEAGSAGLRLVVDDGFARTFDEVVLSARFSRVALVAADGVAKVAIPENGTMGQAWQLAGFDDAAWQAGVLGAGYDANKGKDSRRIYSPLIGAGLDLETAMSGVAKGCYLRVPFEVVEADSVLSLSFRLKYDDGFVAYLNGVEIARGNVPGGAPSWSTGASTDRDDVDALSSVLFQVPLVPGTMVDGTNMLAIHGMNYATGNQDREFVLVPELDATLADLPFVGAVAGVADPGMRGEDDDADGDGRSNFHEHAAGTLVDVSGPGYPMVMPAGGSSVALVLPSLRPDDVRYELLYTPDLTGVWVVAATADGAGPWTGSALLGESPEGEGRVRMVLAGSGEARGFYRLRMSRISP